MANMKTKLQFQTLTAICVLLASLAVVMAQPAAPQFTPSSTVPALDPTTGLPLTQSIPEPQWIDPNWSDPGIVLTNLDYDGLPLTEVARQLRLCFKDQFNILPMPTTFGTNWGDTTISLQLKNVRATDVFNAMNMVFENDRTPLRWQLMNASGPTVMLRVLPDAEPVPSLQTRPSEKHRMVLFVGNLIGDEKSGGMTMDQLMNTLVEAWPEDLGKPDGVIQFHTQAQLLVVDGTSEQNEFVQQMLSALQQKTEWERFKRDSAGAVPKTNDAKSNLKSSDGGAK